MFMYIVYNISRHILGQGITMNSIKLPAPAKINIALDVLGKRPDGYHEVRMLMQQIKLHDTVLIERSESSIDVSCNNPLVPQDCGNIAYKAAKLLLDSAGITSGIKIKIDKKIPMAAGLAGGSTDAAAVLKGINELFALGLSMEQLAQIGVKAGADVPFCIKGGTMLSEGIGEILTPVSPLQGIFLIVVCPHINVSTQWVYQQLRLDRISQRPDFKLLLDSIGLRDIAKISASLVNVLETVTIEKYGIIKDIKEKLVSAGALGSLMSGSGPSVFGIFDSYETAKAACEIISHEGWDVFLTETI